MWGGIRVVFGWVDRDIVFIKEIVFLFYRFLVVGQESSKETDLRDRLCGAENWRPANSTKSLRDIRRPLRIPLGMGHLRTRRQKCFIPTEHIITTRLQNGGSFGLVLVPANHPHGRLLSAAVKSPTGRSVHRGDLAERDSHRITAIRKPICRWDALAHHRRLVFVQSARGTGEAQKAAPSGRLRPSGRRYVKYC